MKKRERKIIRAENKRKLKSAGENQKNFNENLSERNQRFFEGSQSIGDKLILVYLKIIRNSLINTISIYLFLIYHSDSPNSRLNNYQK